MDAKLPPSLQKSKSSETVRLWEEASNSKGRKVRPYESDPPIVKNFQRVLQETGFLDLPPKELQIISLVAQSEAVRLMQPEQLLDVVPQLDNDEREHLTEILVDSQVVPEEQRGVLEEAVRPGGFADKLSASLRYLAWAREYVWLGVALPIVEFVLSILLSMLDCGAPLIVWLRIDAIMALCAGGAAYCTCLVLVPVYRTLSDDPIAAVQRWQSLEIDSWKLQLEKAVPDVDFSTYRFGMLGVIAAVVLVLLGAVWAIIGVLELLATVVVGCTFLTVLFAASFVGLRFGMVYILLRSMYTVLDELQRHRSRAPVLGTSSPR